MWYALHGFIHDFNALDEYLKNNFPQVVQNDMNEYFFIRYWLGGPQVRLRFKADEQDYPVIKNRFKASIDSYLENNDVQLIDYDNYYQKTMLDNENIEKTYWCPHGSVKDFSYAPEYERYGGAEGMEKSENVFCESSRMAMILNKLSYPKRILVGLDLIYLTFKQAHTTNDIYRSYAKMWQSYSDDDGMIDFDNKNVLKKRIEMLKGADSGRFTVYHDYFESLRENGILDDTRLLVSHVHMTNNRLGVTPVLEYELARFIDNHI